MPSLTVLTHIKYMYIISTPLCACKEIYRKKKKNLVPFVPYIRHLSVVKIILDGKYCSVPHSFSIYEKEIKYVNCIRLKYFIHLIGIK